MTEQQEKLIQRYNELVEHKLRTENKVQSIKREIMTVLKELGKLKISLRT